MDVEEALRRLNTLLESRGETKLLYIEEAIMRQIWDKDMTSEKMTFNFMYTNKKVKHDQAHRFYQKFVRG